MIATLVSNNRASSLLLSLLAEHLENAGAVVRALLPGRKEMYDRTTAGIMDLVRGSEQSQPANVALVGMSEQSELAKEELWAAHAALDRRIPFGLYAEIPGALKRKCFRFLLHEASFILLPPNEDLKEIAELCPKAEKFFVPAAPAIPFPDGVISAMNISSFLMMRYNNRAS